MGALDARWSSMIIHNPSMNTVVSESSQNIYNGATGMNGFIAQQQAQASAAQMQYQQMQQHGQFHTPYCNGYHIHGACQRNEESKPKEQTMFGEFKADAKAFMKSHKSTIYTIIGLYLLDHFLFEGKFKAKLMELAGRLVTKLENKVDQIGVNNEAGK